MLAFGGYSVSWTRFNYQVLLKPSTLVRMDRLTIELLRLTEKSQDSSLFMVNLFFRSHPSFSAPIAAYLAIVADDQSILNDTLQKVRRGDNDANVS